MSPSEVCSRDGTLLQRGAADSVLSTEMARVDHLGPHLSERMRSPTGLSKMIEMASREDSPQGEEERERYGLRATGRAIGSHQKRPPRDDEPAERSSIVSHATRIFQEIDYMGEDTTEKKGTFKSLLGADDSGRKPVIHEDHGEVTDMSLLSRHKQSESGLESTDYF